MKRQCESEECGNIPEYSEDTYCRKCKQDNALCIIPGCNHDEYGYSLCGDCASHAPQDELIICYQILTDPRFKGKMVSALKRFKNMLEKEIY